MVTIYRVVFAILGWAALAAQYGLMVRSPGAAVGPLTLNFFSYFTILTNVLVAVVMTLPVLMPGSAAGRLAASNSARAATAMFAVVVGLVYHALLAATWAPTGLQWWVDQALHTVMPLAMLVDWLWLTPRSRLGGANRCAGSRFRSCTASGRWSTVRCPAGIPTGSSMSADWDLDAWRSTSWGCWSFSSSWAWRS